MATKHLLLVFILATFSTSVALGQTNTPAHERFTAVAVDLGGSTSSRATVAHVSITLDRWSSTAEQQRVTTALRGKGKDKLLDLMRRLKPIGRIQVDSGLGWDLRFARMESTGDGRKIILATDRPVSFFEAANPSRYSDYPFTFIELRLDSSGRGEGELLPAARVSASDDGRFVFLENYDIQSVRLNGVEAEKISRRGE